MIEAKKGGASEADARIKLRAFMEQHFGYKVAVLLSINVSPHRVEASLEFIGGETIVIGRDVA